MWETIVGQAIGPVFGLVDSAWYTPQEQAADSIARENAAAQRDAADAQRYSAAAGLAAVEVNARTMQTLGFVAAGVAGLGLIVWASK